MGKSVKERRRLILKARVRVVGLESMEERRLNSDHDGNFQPAKRLTFCR